MAKSDKDRDKNGDARFTDEEKRRIREEGKKIIAKRKRDDQKKDGFRDKK